MSSETDYGDGDKGAPPTKPKVGGGYRQRYHQPRREIKNPAATRPARVTFSGLTEYLKGHIYNVGTGSLSDQFTATTKALAIYSSWKCDDPQDIQIAIDRRKEISIPIPTTKTNIKEEVAKLLLGKEIYTYVNLSQQYR